MLYSAGFDGDTGPPLASCDALDTIGDLSAVDLRNVDHLRASAGSAGAATDLSQL